METPAHSPEILDRYFPSCYSPQKKTRRQPITAKHLDSNFCDLGSGLDVLLREIDFSSHVSSIDQPFGSKDVMNITGNPYQKSKSFRRSSPYNWDGCDLQSTFRNDEITCNIQDRSSNIWNGSSFLNESMDDLGEYEPFSKKWVDQRDTGFDDYFNCKDLQKQDLNFEDWDQPKKRSCVKRTEAFNMKGSPVSYPKHRTILNIDVVFSDNMCSSPIGIEMDDKDAIHHMPRVDTTERRLPSEESCSSTAVRGDATRKS